MAATARLALEAPIEGAEVAIIAAAETVMTRASADLMAEVFPNVPLRRPVEGSETLLAIHHARRPLGYEPADRWADHVSESAASASSASCRTISAAVRTS